MPTARALLTRHQAPNSKHPKQHHNYTNYRFNHRQSSSIGKITYSDTTKHAKIFPKKIRNMQAVKIRGYGMGLREGDVEGDRVIWVG
jgi:hypothetical protein